MTDVTVGDLYLRLNHYLFCQATIYFFLSWPSHAFKDQFRWQKQKILKFSSKNVTIHTTQKRCLSKTISPLPACDLNTFWMLEGLFIFPPDRSQMILLCWINGVSPSTHSPLHTQHSLLKSLCEGRPHSSSGYTDILRSDAFLVGCIDKKGLLILPYI